MKIAFICPYYDPAIDGPKQVIKELASRLIKDNHEVHVFTSDFDKYKRIKKKEEIIDKVHVHRCFSFFKVANFVNFFPSVFFKLLKEDFDIIHTHVYGHPHVFFASLAAKLKGTKLIHTTHCPWTQAYRSFLGRILLNLTYPTLSKFAVNLSNKIIAITPWELEFFKRYKIRKPIIIPNGVDNLFFEKIKNNSFKKKLKIKEKIVLFFGRLNITKGPDKFVLAAKEILKERKDINFLIIGPDEGMKGKLQRMINNDKNILLLDPIYDRKKIAEMYQVANVFTMPSFREGLPLCCHPNVLIETKNGLKKIEDIQLNEMVLTHTGKLCKVTKTMKRHISEEIICIKPYGINQEIKITEDHPILAIKKPKKRFGKSIGKIITEINPIWIKAGELNEGDCVAFPIPKYESNLKYFDLSKFDNSLRYSSNQVWYKMGFSGKNKEYSYSDLVKKTSETKKIIEEAIKYLKNKNLTPRSERIKKILNFLRNNNISPKEANKYPRFIKIDNQLAYVFGWYIAEGSPGDGFIRFSLNKNEIDYAKEIDKIISTKFGIKGNISIEDNRLVLVFCGKILEILFPKLCGKGAENKRIPPELFNQKLLPHIIKGLFLGDGYFNKAGWSLTTASRQLANDTILSLLKLKKKFNFHQSKRGVYNICYQPNNPNVSHSNKSWFIEDKYLCFMIRSIKKEKYSGLVYNLEIEKDNSYTTNSFSVHNCLFEAMASGLPIIASPVNGVKYEMTKNNGIFVNYGDINGLKQATLKILDNDKLANRYALNNKKTALKYKWDLIYQKTLEIYKKVLAT